MTAADPQPHRRRQTRWKPQRCFPRTQLPGQLFDWLLDPASLTLRLQQLCQGALHVSVLSQQWGHPRLDERRVLRMQSGRRALIRQVELLCDTQPWVYARTIIPARSLVGARRRLARLGNRPLGAMLFSERGMQRSGVELARVIPGQDLFADAVCGLTQVPDEIWGRRSLFQIAGRPLLVSEIFLPGFPAGHVRGPFWKTP